MPQESPRRAFKRHCLDVAHLVLTQHVDDFDFEKLFLVCAETVAILKDDRELQNRVRARCNKPPYQPKEGNF